MCHFTPLVSRGFYPIGAILSEYQRTFCAEGIRARSGLFRLKVHHVAHFALGAREVNPVSYNVEQSNEQWREELSADEFAVLRQAATERPWTGELLDESREGIYRCRACRSELFRSATKFDSHCGWPSFYDPSSNDAVELIEDLSMGIARVEVRCANCGSHLGHVFEDAPQTPTGERYCMNSVSLSFEETAN